jgi:hypothetical protein
MKRPVLILALFAVLFVVASTASAATPGQDNARRKAASYLQFESFSRTGLIKQLKYEGFTTAQAVYGVTAMHANWSREAWLKAKEYLKFDSFSRSGLIAQLRYEGFTLGQATYGVTRTGL